MKRFKNILFKFEASAVQDSAIARAVSLAEINQADLTVIDVMQADTASCHLPPGEPISAKYKAATLAERRQALESFIAPYKQRLSIRLDVLVGKTFLELIRAVLRSKYDLVIKTAEDPNWVERLFGSDDMHLLRKCPCPIWLTKPVEKPNYDCIVAAVDFDPLQPESVGQDLNKEILELSSSLALSDFAALHLVHAWEAAAEGIVRSWSDDPDAAASSYVEGVYTHHQIGIDLLQQTLRDQIGREAFDHLSPSFHLIRGSAAKVVPELTSQLQADLVVMGTVARTGISGLFIGNTAEAILDQLRCSVLAIKPPGFVSPVKLDS